MAYIEIAEMTSIDKLTKSCRPTKKTIAVEDFADDKMVHHRKDIFTNDYDLLCTIEN